MKNLIIMFFFTGFSVFAAPEPQVRGSVDSNLSTDRGYVRVASIPIEIIVDGNVLPAARFLHPNTWNPDLSIEKLKTLLIPAIHLNSNGVKTEAKDSFLVPFVSEIRFQQRGDSVKILSVNAGEGVQGTIRFAGTLRTRVLNNAVAAVETKVETYSLSNPPENLAANLTEHINRYDGRFINDVAISIFNEVFKQNEYRNILLNTITKK